MALETCPPRRAPLHALRPVLHATQEAEIEAYWQRREQQEEEQAAADLLLGLNGDDEDAQSSDDPCDEAFMQEVQRFIQGESTADARPQGQSALTECGQLEACLASTSSGTAVCRHHLAPSFLEGRNDTPCSSTGAKQESGLSTTPATSTSSHSTGPCMLQLQLASEEEAALASSLLYHQLSVLLGHSRGQRLSASPPALLQPPYTAHAGSVPCTLRCA